MMRESSKWKKMIKEYILLQINTLQKQMCYYFLHTTLLFRV